MWKVWFQKLGGYGILNRITSKKIKTNGLSLSNPKTFLPLLLFIGFVFVLIGIGFWTFTRNSGLTLLGVILILISIVLFVGVD